MLPVVCRLTGGAQRLFARGGPPGWQTVEFRSCIRETRAVDQRVSTRESITRILRNLILNTNISWNFYDGARKVFNVCIFIGKFGYVSSMRSFRFCYINSRRLCKWNSLYVLKIFHLFTRRKINRKIQVLRQDKFAIDIDDRYTWKYLEHYFKKIT